MTTPSRDETKCNSILFRDVCSLFEKIYQTTGTNKKLDIFFDREMKNFIGTGSLFPLLRLVLPLIDSERGRYGIKQANLAKTYINVLHLDKNTSIDAQRLLFWKDPNKAGKSTSKVQIISGDFCSVLEDVLRSRVRATPSSLTVGDINNLLDELSGSANEQSKMSIIQTKVLDILSPLEQKWLFRIVFQDLKLGLKHEQVLGRFYQGATQRFNECTNLRTVCEEEGTESQGKRAGIQLFNRISPMLAKGFMSSQDGQSSAVVQAMGDDPFVMDVKLDGERMLFHIQNNDIMLYTRNGTDYTRHYFPLAQFVKTHVRVQSCLLDGEVLAWNNESESYIPFGHNLTIGREERECFEAVNGAAGWQQGVTSWMVFVVFDIIYIDGPNALDIIRTASKTCGISGDNNFEKTGDICALPLILRRQILQDIVIEEKHRFEHITSRCCYSRSSVDRKTQLEEFFNMMMDRREEGLVVKRLNSMYLLGEASRQAALWVKMKPEYGLTDDLDLLVLGAYYGEGRSVRGRGLSRFLLGVKNASGGYDSLCKVGTGYSFTELNEIREKIQKVGKVFDWKKPPMFLAHWKIGKIDDRPDIYLEPQDSFVVQLKCADIVESTQFSAGVTCRFPRLQKFRYDKNIDEINTLQQVLEIKSRPRASKTSEIPDEDGPPHVVEASSQSSSGRGKKRKILPEEKESKNTVDDTFILRNKEVDVKSFIFQDKIFCVMGTLFQTNNSVDMLESSMPSQFSKQQIVDIIRGHGAIVVANPVKGCQVIAGERNYQISNIMKQAEYDILNISYILDCIRAKTLLPLKGLYLMGCSPATRSQIDYQEDIFGDSFTQIVNLQELTQIVNHADDAIEIFRHLNDASSRSNKKQSLSSIIGQKLQEIDSIQALSWRELESIIEEEYNESLIPKEHFQSNYMWNKDMVIYVYRISSLESSFKVMESILAISGANYRNNFTDEVTVVIVTLEFLDPQIHRVHNNFHDLKELIQRYQDKISFLSETWIHDCVSNGHLLELSEKYLLKESNP